MTPISQPSAFTRSAIPTRRPPSGYRVRR
jgi:hypothetical protein